MKEKILVTYATRYGATKEIAEKMGEVLREAAFETDVLPVGSVDDLTPYRAVVLGSGVYIGQWNKQAAKFLQANEKALAEMPVWLFSSGPTGTGDPVTLVKGWRLPASLQESAERVQPVDTTVFHGYINPEKLHFIQRWVLKNIVKVPFGDFRDWDAITGWARSIASVLLKTEMVSGE